MSIRRLMRRRLLVRLLDLGLAAGIVATASLTAPAASAGDRPFPPIAKRGTMMPDLFPSIVIDGKPRIMTPGARIWSAENMLVTPASLLVKNTPVNYTENESFYIDRVWILTPEEAAESPAQQKINQPR